MIELKKALLELLSGKWNPEKQRIFNEIILKMCLTSDIKGISPTFCADLAVEKILPILANPITAAYRAEGIVLAKELYKLLPEYEKVHYKAIAEWTRGKPVTAEIRECAMSLIRWGLEKYGLDKLKDIVKKEVIYTSREYKNCRTLMENCPYLYKVGETRKHTNYLFNPAGFTKVDKLITDLFRFVKSLELKELIEKRKREIKVTEKERELLRKLAEELKDHIRTEREILEDRLKELEEYVDFDWLRICVWLDRINWQREKLGKPIFKNPQEFISFKLKEKLEKITPELAKYIKTE